MFKEYLELFNAKEFNKILQSFRKNFSCLGEEKEYKKNEFLIFNTGNEIIMFEDGAADIGIEGCSGKECLLYKIVEKGDLIGDSDFFSNKNNSYIIKFVEDTKLRFISKEEIEEFLEEHPEGYKYFYKYVLRSHNISLNYLVHHRFSSSEERIIEFLIRIANKNILISNYTHESIGSFTNLSRNLVSKILKNLEKLDLIKVEFKKIILVDIEKLELYRETLRK